MHNMYQAIVKRTMYGIMGALLLTALATSSSVVFAASTPPPIIHEGVILMHAPSGNAFLSWDPRTHNLSVKITLSGLVPFSTHPAHIHAGDDCSRNGDAIYPLNDIVAGGNGNAVTTTVIPNVDGGIPTRSWYINIHNGPGMDDPDQGLAIACGNVKNDGHSNSLLVRFNPTTAPNQASYGIASLDIINGKLVVRVDAEDFVPGSTHPAELHQGTCQNQTFGNVAYVLNPLVANENGDAISITTFDEVTTIPHGAWYMTIHYGEDLSTQTGADILACGNVRG